MEIVLNYIGGEWRNPQVAEFVEVHNPATADILARTPLCNSEEVNAAAQAAQEAFPDWRRTPVTERVQHLFKLKTLLEANFEDLASTITLENGKTLEEARGELRRAIENVEVACGMPALMQGYNNEDVAVGIDEMMIRQPLGVCTTIAPFNFPAMIPFWFMPYAIAAGNTYIIKPSERVPLTMQKIFHLIEQTGLPKGVVNLVNGAKEAVNALLDHPLVRGVTFVGATATARHVYARAALNGKRVQAQGGAKNPVVIMPDADQTLTTQIVADSAFGTAGQRCLAASIAITVGEARGWFTEMICDAASDRVVGYGLEPGVQMGPVISMHSRQRIESLITRGGEDGGSILVDGRGTIIPRYEDGFFVRPTVIADIAPGSELARTEIFGPVLGLMHVNSLEEAIALVNDRAYGNMACIFTTNGGAARKFRYEVEAGNIGVNIGVAAPMAFFPFSGWKESFFGNMHGQGWDAVEFFTQEKVVIERWPKEWSRKF